MSEEASKVVSGDNHASSMVSSNSDDKLSLSEPKSPTTSEQKSPKSVKSDDKETKVSGIKAPATSRIGRLCLAHHAPKAGPPPPEPKYGDNQSDETMSRLSEEYPRSPLTDVSEENEMDFLRGKFSRSSISPDHLLSRPPKADRKISNGSVGGDLYLEATGRRRSSDHGVVLTTDTDSFIIGQKVWVGGIRPGQIAYIGETHFAPGDWAGIVLDEPNGKNDGCVSGKRYFQCEPKKGIFSRLTRLTHYPLPNASPGKETSPGLPPRSILSPERSRATSPTSSIRSSMRRSPGKQGMTVGDRVIVSSGLGSRAGILKYMGETKFAQGTWCGVQLDEASGKNDGSVDGIRYFECPPKYGVFVPIAKVTLSPSSRKSRLSRAGSRESLTSVGTLNSVATTNTSRLRMGVQRIPTATKLASAPKNTYSLQDVIREKQNHIEQLMIERDLDREDAQNQAMLFQKNISELKNRVAELEKLLEDEKKKSEELQYNIDEAQFCGDELNAQTQVYREKILELEQRLLSTGVEASSASESALSKYTTEYDILKKENDKLIAEIESLRNALNDRTKDFEFKSKDLAERELQIQEEVEFLRQENEEMRKELLAKDESTEKLYLTIQELQNTLLEETIASKQSSDEIEVKTAKFIKSCSEKDEQIKSLQADVEILKEQIDVAAKKNEDSNRNLKNFEEENVVLRSELEKTTKELASLRELQENVACSNEESQKFVNVLKNEIESLKAVQINLSEQNKQLQSSLDAKTQELVDNTKRLEEVQHAKENSLKENESVKSQLAGISNNVTALESEIVLKEQEAETNKILIEELNKKVKDLDEKMKQNDESSSKLLESSTAQNEQLIKYKADYEALQKEFEVISTNLAEREDALSKLKSDYESNHNLLIVVTKDKEQLIADSQKDKESLNNQINDLNKKLENQINDLNKKLEESNLLTSGLKSLEEQLKETELQKNNLLQELEKVKVELKTLNDENVSKSSTMAEQSLKLQELSCLVNEKQLQSDEFSKSIKYLNDQCENLKNIKATLETRIGELEVENGDKARTIDTLTQKCDEISNQYQTLQKELTNLKNTSSDTNSEVVRLTENLVEKQKAFEELLNNSNTTKNKLERDLHESTQNISALKNEIETLKSQIDAKDKTKEEMQTQSESLKAAIESKDKEIESLKQVIQSGKDNLQKIIAANFSESESLKSQLDSQISSLQKEISALESELENTKHKSNDTEQSLLKQISEYGNEKEQLLNELKNLKDSEISLQSLVEKQKESESSSIQTFKIQLQKKDEEIKTLNDTIVSMKDASHNLNLKLADMELSCKSLQESNEAIKSELTAETNKAKECMEQIDKLKAVIDERDAEKDKIIKVNAELESKVASSEKDKTNVLETLKLSQGEKDEAINNLRAEITLKDEQNTELRMQLKKEQEITKDLSARVEELSGLSEDVNKQLTQKEGTITAQADNILQLSELVSQLQCDVNNNKQQMAEIISTYTKQIEALNKTLEEKSEECSKLLKDSAQLKSQSNSQSEQLSASLLKEIESQKVLSNKYQTLTQEHELCKTKINDLEKLIANYDKTINELTTKIINLEETLKSNANKNSNVQSEYEKLQKNFSKLQQDKSATEMLLSSEISKLKSAPQQSKESNKTGNEENDSVEHINFLNSIIADMQKKNEGLKARIEAMEAVPLDFTKPEAFNIVGRRNPAPRLFCDICEIFDAHDTEDCPQQSSDSPVSSLPRSVVSSIPGGQNGESAITKKLPPPRMFCDFCEIFDAHETEDCDSQCF